MRYLNMLFGLAMLGFAVVQYNDPDALLWIIYYSIPAVWALLAAFRVAALRSASGKRWLWVSIAVWTALVIYYWPSMPGFWRREVFMVEETAREGMGLMLAWLSLLVALFSALRPARGRVCQD